VGSFALLYKTLFSVLSIFSFIEGVPCVTFCVAPVACEFRRARRGLRFYLTLRVLTGTQLFRLVPDILSIFFFEGSVVSVIVFVLRHTLYWKGKIVSPNERLVETAIQHFDKKFVSLQRTGKYISFGFTFESKV
jgi:hypothetical protein